MIFTSAFRSVVDTVSSENDTEEGSGAGAATCVEVDTRSPVEFVSVVFCDGVGGGAFGFDAFTKVASVVVVVAVLVAFDADPDDTKRELGVAEEVFIAGAIREMGANLFAVMAIALPITTTTAIPR